MFAFLLSRETTVAHWLTFWLTLYPCVTFYENSCEEASQRWADWTDHSFIHPCIHSCISVHSFVDQFLERTIMMMTFDDKGDDNNKRSVINLACRKLLASSSYVSGWDNEVYWRLSFTILMSLSWEDALCFRSSIHPSIPPLIHSINHQSSYTIQPSAQPNPNDLFIDLCIVHVNKSNSNN